MLNNMSVKQPESSWWFKAPSIPCLVLQGIERSHVPHQRQQVFDSRHWTLYGLFLGR